jgi:hypothetical protein
MFRPTIVIRFIHCLFSNAACCSDYIMAQFRMISEQGAHKDAEGNGRGLNETLLRHSFGRAVEVTKVMSG